MTQGEGRGQYLGRRAPGAAGAAPQRCSTAVSWPSRQPRWLWTRGGWPGSPETGAGETWGGPRSTPGPFPWGASMKPESRSHVAGTERSH